MTTWFRNQLLWYAFFTTAVVSVAGAPHGLVGRLRWPPAPCSCSCAHAVQAWCGCVCKDAALHILCCTCASGAGPAGVTFVCMPAMTAASTDPGAPCRPSDASCSSVSKHVFPGVNCVLCTVQCGRSCASVKAVRGSKAPVVSLGLEDTFCMRSQRVRCGGDAQILCVGLWSMRPA